MLDHYWRNWEIQSIYQNISSYKKVILPEKVFISALQIIRSGPPGFSRDSHSLRSQSVPIREGERRGKLAARKGTKKHLSHLKGLRKENDSYQG